MKTLRMVVLPLLASALLLGVASCGSDDKNTTPDTKTEDTAEQPDGVQNDLIETDVPVPTDTAEDLIEDVPTPEDTKPEDLAKPDEIEDDVTPPEDVDVPDTTDVATPDIEADETTPEDVVDPESCGYGDNLAGLMKCVEGPIDVMLKGVVVTYVFDKGFFVADASASRGMEFYLPTPTFTMPTAGDVLDCHVLNLTNYKGQQEITEVDTCTKTGDADPSDYAVELVTGSVAPSEENESMLVKGVGMTVVSLTGNDAVVSYGTQAAVTVRLDSPLTLCAGATFDMLRGVVTQYDTHRIQVFVASSDLLNINTTNCGAAPVYDDSNWGFEEVGTDDPPADFEKATALFTAMRDTSAFHTGAASCNLTWTSMTNQDFYQGYYMPVTAGQTATFSVWAKDEVEGGKVRQGLMFYAADKSLVGSSNYSSTYTTTGPDWQQLTYEFTAPEGAVYVRGMVRMYDDGAAWANSASVLIDDWSLTLQ